MMLAISLTLSLCCMALGDLSHHSWRARHPGREASCPRPLRRHRPERDAGSRDRARSQRTRDRKNHRLRHQHPAVRGINFQPAFHAGRHMQHDPMQRITIPDILKMIEEQTDKKFMVSDFIPVPCCFPTCNSVTYAFIDGRAGHASFTHRQCLRVSGLHHQSGDAGLFTTSGAGSGTL
jgi:hypothetical protein